MENNIQVFSILPIREPFLCGDNSSLELSTGQAENFVDDRMNK